MSSQKIIRRNQKCCDSFDFRLKTVQICPVRTAKRAESDGLKRLRMRRFSPPVLSLL